MIFDWFNIAVALVSFCLGLAARVIQASIDGWIRSRRIFGDAEKQAQGQQKILQQNELHRAELDISSKMRMASIDRRLQAHQEAFALWRELFFNVHGDECTKVVMKCQAWWDANCLYLEPSVREDFSRAYASAGNHQALLNSERGVEGGSAHVQENWKAIIRPGTTIPLAVELPPIKLVDERSVGAEGQIEKK